MAEEVQHPSHYGGDTPYEVMKVLRAWNLEGAKWFCWGNVIKYLSRAEKKGGLKDYEKADWYATELVAIEAELAHRPKKATPSEIPLVINGNGNYKLHVDWDNRKTRLEYMGGGGSGGSNAPGPVTGGIGGSSVGGGGGATHFNTGTGSNYASGVGGAGGGAHWPEPVTQVKRCVSAFRCKGGYHDSCCPLYVKRSGNG